MLSVVSYDTVCRLMPLTNASNHKVFLYLHLE